MPLRAAEGRVAKRIETEATKQSPDPQQETRLAGLILTAGVISSPGGEDRLVLPAKVEPTLLLIVEDHATLRASLRDWMRSAFPDCQVLEAQSGEEAVELAAAHRPRLVLMDISLPGMNGIEATRQIKDTLPQTSVVMLSIHAAQRYRMEAEAAGASAYVTKAKMRTELIPTVTGLLSRLQQYGDAKHTETPKTEVEHENTCPKAHR
jgi:DNA-binding NarL/FixJ family response regulator